MKKIFFLILKILLIALTLIFTFTNVVAGIAFLNIDKTVMGIKLIVLTVIGYDIATVLVLFKKEITGFILSLIGSLVLVAMRSDFMQLKSRSEGLALYETRHLPSLFITAVILIFAVIKLVKIIKEKKRQKALRDRQKSPSIFK